MVKKWQTINKENKGDFKIFKVDWVTRKHPDREKEAGFVVVDSPKWVNIIPITTDNKIVFVRQFRHGINDFTLEVPGGLVDDGESARQAGERECIEETGYSSPEKAVQLGYNQPNPAFLSNLSYHFLWENCTLTDMQKLDGNEEIDVILLSPEEVKEFILSGKIKHSLVLTAFMFYYLRNGF